MVSWVAKSWLGAWGGHLQQQIFVGVCGVGRWGEPRFKHKTESETDILHAFLWVPAWSGIHLKQALLLLCPGYSRTNQKGPENNPLTGSIQTYSWCGFGLSLLESILKLCVPCFKETAISLPFSWSPCCGMWYVTMLGKEWGFWGRGRGGMSTAEIHISEAFLAHCDTLDKSLGFHI